MEKTTFQTVDDVFSIIGEFKGICDEIFRMYQKIDVLIKGKHRFFVLSNNAYLF